MNARELLQKATGLNLTETVVQRALRQRMRALAIDDGADYLRQLGGDAELKALTELVVVPESWLFRDPKAFVAATDFVLRRLAAHPERTVRILSVPCAGGEEPYSMAMALREAGVPAAACSIDAVDLSDVAIARARQGLFTRNAFRGGKLDFRERHFSAEGADYRISEALRDHVSFRQGNLMAPDFAAAAGRYDVIFCRNLLIYFDEPTSAAAIARLSAMLADDGILLAGYAEVPSFCRHGFQPVRAPGAFAVQKAGAAVAAPPPPPARIRAAPRPISVDIPGAAPRPAQPHSATVPAASQAEALATARIQADRGQLQAAAAACHALLGHTPDAAEAYFILGLVSECEQHSEAAAEHWRRCVYLQPDHYEALCHLALLAEQSGDAAQAGSLRQRAARIFQRTQGTKSKASR